MKNIYQDILHAVANKKRLLAVLLDPDKLSINQIPEIVSKINRSIVTHILIGGSIIEESVMDPFVIELKKQTELPIVIFPGDITQISNHADGLLFLSLISGRNPEFLIEKQVQSVSKLRGSNLEVIPTGYILIENGKETAVQRVSQTKPMSRGNTSLIVDTAKAGELLGMKLIYLEAGSGATHPINREVISKVKADLNMPLIVGGGISNKEQLDTAYTAGADMVVIGTAFEQNDAFFNELI